MTKIPYTIKNLIQKNDHFFIHKSLQEKIEDFGKARILLYAMFITTLLPSSYSINYELTHDNIHIVKHIANFFGFQTGPLGLILLKPHNRLNLTLFIMQAISISLVFTSTYIS